jgi:hypothetical protein
MRPQLRPGATLPNESLLATTQERTRVRSRVMVGVLGGATFAVTETTYWL